MLRRFIALGVLGLLAACAGSPGSPQDEIVITIEHSSFRPPQLSVEPGATVTFVVRNTDPIDHEFILGDEELQDVHEKGTEMHHGARPGELSIPAGEERTTTYTFPQSGRLIYGCHIPGHYAFGMKGFVTIG
jgi:uncharacterized cupredoxin-like copper-binding protein